MLTQTGECPIRPNVAWMKLLTVTHERSVSGECQDATEDDQLRSLAFCAANSSSVSTPDSLSLANFVNSSAMRLL